MCTLGQPTLNERAVVRGDFGFGLVLCLPFYKIS